MRVKVNQLKCKTNAVCVNICPQVFRLQPGNNKAKVLLDPVPKEYEENCRNAALKCPTGAISIIEV